VDAALRGQFSQHGITLSESATLTIPAPSRVWQLNDVGNNLIYTICLETKSDNTQVLTVYAKVDSASLVDAYMPDAVLTGANLYGVHANGAQFYGSQARLDGSAILEGVEFNDDLTLRWQASVAVDTAGKQWLLDNDSENPQNFSTGYVKFIVKLIVDGSMLDVYGTAVRIERLGDNNQLQMDTETCNLTAIAVTNMNSQTTCPNGTRLGVNQQGGKNWDELWLRAAPGKMPKPPTCVPTDYNWCPAAATSTESAPDSIQHSPELTRSM
jgi:hypothetical protein